MTLEKDKYLIDLLEQMLRKANEQKLHLVDVHYNSLVDKAVSEDGYTLAMTPTGRNEIVLKVIMED